MDYTFKISYLNNVNIEFKVTPCVKKVKRSVLLECFNLNNVKFHFLTKYMLANISMFL